MEEEKKINVTVKISTVRFYNEESNFGIVTAFIDEIHDREPVLDKWGKITLKGNMPCPRKMGVYLVEATEIIDPKWGTQYLITKMITTVILKKDDKVGQRKYLETLFTEKQVKDLYDALENPYKVLMDKNVKELVKVKGCGFKTASRMMAKFEQDIFKSRIYVELSEYDLSPAIIDRLYNHYQNADIVIENVKRNPYILMNVQNIGWSRCDSIALKGGLGVYSPERVEAFISHYLYTKAQEGYTYVYSNEQLMPAILESLGEAIPDEAIAAGIKRMGKKVWWSDDKEAIGLTRYVKLEMKIAQKLIELRDAPNEFKYDGWEEIIKKKEEDQGWCFTEQQMEGIKASLENQVVIITGLGGTGKSSIVAGVVEVLQNYRYAQCALSGRAAARLAEVTGQEGHTIHRLLGYPMGDDEHQKFAFHEDCPIDYDIVIIDEISMVDGDLFYNLIRALSPGTKLIMLGDVGQLESIGCANIANDLIESPEIVSVVLDKIHRQAEASAIITESIKSRNGIQVIDKDYAGIVTKGELQDLTYDCYSDGSNTFYRTMQYVSKLLEEGNSILDIQVVVPIKERGAGTWMLNSAIQELYNDEFEKQLTVNYDKEHVGYIRPGDKVINVKNNYNAKTYENQWDLDLEDTKNIGESCPIFNGNMGIVLDINEERGEAIVDFIGIGKVLITKNMLSSLMLGYAVTVHKCQGSEFPYVLFAMDFSSYSLLTRQLVYTAITRAKKHCYVIAQTSALRFAISQNSVINKQTLLQNAIYDAAHPKIVF